MNKIIVGSVLLAFSDLVHKDEVQNVIYDKSGIMIPMDIIEDIQEIIKPTYEELSAFVMFDGSSEFYTNNWNEQFSDRLFNYYYELYGYELNELTKKIKIGIENE